ncbi:uncharacterized protein K460DRAFT_426952 [Cucurbitaria berberidis CBS 394.84]|uniref:Lysine-specific metallo-endopeptidase domain-containing protein n=1 Tax=Cucurbitaria berberidis CBS 394.84 TaxID=1168544 RepID=A0A9P4GKI6_9PLEO|nr:uncharacterized protein K460DRAFT_426952 [Cucurbitaria berberidis CBS 394.84]KAF1848008.1 hypothetical protein K460DRAFT_426952 [Cucurbitaria berberidis CBS 394.84]
MRSIILSLALSIAFASQTMAFTYWVDDKSCTGDRSLTEALKETKLMGEKASERLKSSSDADYQHVYEFLMKRKKSDKAELDKIEGKMTEVKDRNTANIRIYCDDEKRWKPRVDPKTGQNTGGWEDPENWMQYSGRFEWSQPGCHDKRWGELYTYAQTYKTYMNGEPSQKQADVRATVTICELGLFTENKKPRRVLSQLQKDLDLTKPPAGIEVLALHPSKTILHELSHFHGYDTIDNGYFISNPKANPNIRSLDAGELMKNADVRAYLGQLAILADRGYTFQRTPLESASKEEKADFSKNMEIGKLFLYPNLTKRGLRNIGRLARRYNKA